MTKEEILHLIQQEKEKGMSYKGIAQLAGLKAQDIYDYTKRTTPMTRIHNALEKYFIQED